MSENTSTIKYTYLFDTIDPNNVKDVVKAIDEANANPDITEVRLVMNSSGGKLYSAFGLYDHIKSSKKPVDIIVEGCCMSAAVVILQAARKRYSYKHTVFMVHPSHWTYDRSSFDETIVMVEQSKLDHDLFTKLTSERAGLSQNELEKVYIPRKYMTADEALKFGNEGLIDEII